MNRRGFFAKLAGAAGIGVLPANSRVRDLEREVDELRREIDLLKSQKLPDNVVIYITTTGTIGPFEYIDESWGLVQTK